MSWGQTPERPAVAPPPRGDEPPSRRLASGAKWAWRLHLVGVWVGVAVAGTLLAQVVDIAGAIVFTASVVVFAAAILLIPPLRYRRWRWDLRPDVIDIQHGTFTVRRTLVPLVRVQHVDTKRGVLEQMLDLSTVVVHTAAGSHTIPYLSDLDADELRDRIAALARTGDA
jgi:membrane protein YdbS with pleckstrin-like domain